ncbi:uncharacterized protein LOC132720586 [Ruditapes philippinarum]|uniref:uncharacterized protein LOC132720586 n=1 Tax=Ruditapes philippinarum TaxID=129788 RepID=UPI00295BF2C4|nr:uncharacterized protein LOC132720586 [Ruditapes philippinarum]
MKMLLVFSALTVIAVCQPVYDFVNFVNRPYVFSISTESPVGSRLGSLQAYSMTGKAVKYSIVSGDSTYFNLDPTTGEITVAQSLPKDIDSLEFEAQAATSDATSDAMDRTRVTIYCIRV